jgi:hypothetical protein
MTKIIEVHGLRFAVESEGFLRANAEADRDAGVEAIEAALARMDGTQVHAIHAAGLEWVANDCVGERPGQYDDLERVGLNVATAGWRRPDAVYLTVSAAK